MLSAKLIRATSKVAVYEVKGTSSELKAYEASVTASGQTIRYKTDGVDGPQVLNELGEPIPLFFTPFPMPGKDQWHPLVQIQSGPNKGKFTLDTEALNYDKLIAKSLGQDLGEHITAQLAQRHTGVLSNAPKSRTITLTDDDEDLTAESDDQTASASASADMDALAEQPVAKATAKTK